MATLTLFDADGHPQSGTRFRLTWLRSLPTTGEKIISVCEISPALLASEHGPADTPKSLHVIGLASRVAAVADLTAVTSKRACHVVYLSDLDLRMDDGAISLSGRTPILWAEISGRLG